MARAWVGTSGWAYAHWENGAFYPPRLPPAEHLPFFAQAFATVEINYSYYRLPPRTTFDTWRSNVPADFVFAVKASRYLTHMKKLKDPEQPLERLLHNAGGLGPNFGPVLFQFPARWKLDLDRLQGFMAALDAHPSRRYAFEFRHQSWLTADVYACLRDKNAALCLPVGLEIPLDPRLTADWTYLRFHAGRGSLFFEDDELAPWAGRLIEWRAQGIESFTYFNNDGLWRGRPAAIDNARRLREMIDA
ncbi:MAG TPA: DUF72 domain-containing protein [Chloroflexota bacterium]